ncbi:hypothetical protein EHS25_005200 [Saitozyma podzolica]|uniref:Uncharacterized protein n=1 Tax=Saitozyma podzolica TaxID=1890683 RepID=A0A427XYJ8_9TREE|nr:hypothetical protein EHS25_005200 [Saitozyma podzolica]
MPIHTLASAFGSASSSQLVLGGATLVGVYSTKVWAGGKRSAWERDWAGKMILIVAHPTPTILTLIDHLLHLPAPPQILFLPPIASLPPPLVTLLHTIRLGATNPLAQLHAEALPPTPEGVRDFTRKWGTAPEGTVEDGGRRVDAIVLGTGWEVAPASTAPSSSPMAGEWSTHEFHFHLITSLLPYLLRAPVDRNIRIISLVSPTWAAGIPSLQGKPTRDSPVTISARKGVTTLLLTQHLQLILDTLASAQAGAVKPVPDPDAPRIRKRDEGVKSNINALSVVMPWARSEVVRGAMGADESTLMWFLYILFFPLLIILTPSPYMAIQSVLFALCAPELDSSSRGEDRRAGIIGGDVVRDCAVIDLPPVFSDPLLAKANYDALEKQVEERMKAGAKAKK